jgi:hypothetical protein
MLKELQTDRITKLDIRHAYDDQHAIVRAGAMYCAWTLADGLTEYNKQDQQPPSNSLPLSFTRSQLRN